MTKGFLSILTFVSSFAVHAGDVPPPTLGLGLSKSGFEEAVRSYQESLQDRMGFSLEPCSLSVGKGPPTTYWIARAIRVTGTEEAVVLVTLKDEKVSGWAQYELPGFEYWITKYNIECQGDRLNLKLNGRVASSFEWTGGGFRAAKVKKLPRKTKGSSALSRELGDA